MRSVGLKVKWLVLSGVVCGMGIKREEGRGEERREGAVLSDSLTTSTAASEFSMTSPCSPCAAPLRDISRKRTKEAEGRGERRGEKRRGEERRGEKRKGEDKRGG